MLGGEPVRPQGPPTWPFANPAVEQALRQSLNDGSWGRYHGPHCPELVRRLTEFHDCEHTILCCSGTAAIELALRGMKVGAGDEVILAAYDFAGNYQNILTVGATPVLVDIHPAHWNLDPSRLESAFSPSTKAIIVSHLHGGTVCMPVLMELARSHGIPVIEDACQAPGAVVYGRRAGTWGDVGILSFGGSKLLSAGRGGALLTNRADIVQRIKLHVQRGNDAYPLSELQAAIVLPQLDELEAANHQRTDNVARLKEWLGDNSGLRMFQSTQKRPANNSAESGASTDTLQPGFYKLGFQYHPDNFDGLPRDDFATAMRAEGIAIDPGFRALHVIHSTRRFRAAGDLSEATQADHRALTLHHPVLLGTPQDMHEIVLAVEKIRTSATQIKETIQAGIVE